MQATNSGDATAAANDDDVTVGEPVDPVVAADGTVTPRPPLNQLFGGARTAQSAALSVSLSAD